MDNQIPISSDLKFRVEHEATLRGMSVAEFVHESLEETLRHCRSADPLFTDDAVFLDDGPADLAANHDKYLYGDAS